MASLAEIRAKLASQENRGSGQSTGGGDNGIFPHWNIPEGTTSVVRFLPDGNESNTFFWVERAMIKLPFHGVKGQDTKMVQVQVPCMEMWGETCPILTEVRPWFNLADYLPKKPGEVELKVIKEMFEASVNNEPFDVARWGQYFRPAGVSVQSTASNSHSDDVEETTKVISMPAVSKPAPVVADDDDAPFDTTPSTPAASSGSSKAEEILRMIKERQKK